MLCQNNESWVYIMYPAFPTSLRVADSTGFANAFLKTLATFFFIICNSRLFTQHMLQLQILKLRKVYNNTTDWTKIT